MVFEEAVVALKGLYLSLTNKQTANLREEEVLCGSCLCCALAIEWTFLPVPEPFIRAPCRKAWNKISAESSLMSPPTTQSVEGLNWTEPTIYDEKKKKSKKKKRLICESDVWLFIVVDLRESDPPVALCLQVGSIEERQADHGDGGRDGDGPDPVQ